MTRWTHLEKKSKRPGYAFPKGSTPLLYQLDYSPSFKYGIHSKHRRVINKQSRRGIIGILTVATAALATGMTATCVKSIGNALPSLEVTFVRALIHILLTAIGCILYKVNPFGASHLRPLLVMHGILGAIASLFFFYSATHMPLAEATVIFHLGPVLTVVLAYLVLGESFTLLDGVSSILSVFGVMMIAKPDFLWDHHMPFKERDDDNADQMKRILSAMSALMAATLSSVASVLVRKIGRRAHFLSIVFYFGIALVIISLVAMVSLQTAIRPNMPDLPFLALTGCTTFVGQGLLNKGLQITSAGPATLMRINEVMFAFLAGVTVFDEYPDILSITGAVLVVGATISLTVRRWDTITTLQTKEKYITECVSYDTVNI